jgi:hypothetical protein
VNTRQCPLPQRFVPLCPPTLAPTTIPSGANDLLALSFMSHTHPTATSSSSSNFELIIDNALNAYKKRTKKDLREHPLAARLQTCDSSGAILAVLQEQAQKLEQSRSTDERWTKWLDPTVKVLHAFVNVLGAAGGPVCLTTCTSLRSAPSFIWQALPSANLIFAGFGALISVCILLTSRGPS